jgi:hypothetical protein
MAGPADLIRRRFDALDPVLDEQARRRFAAAEVRALGRGGVTLVSKVTGIARSTINRGIMQIEENRSAGEGRVRRPGAAGPGLSTPERFCSSFPERKCSTFAPACRRRISRALTDLIAT